MNGLDENGLNVGRPSTIRTWTDLRVDPLAMNVEDVSIEDIAHALARLCRYNGHTGGFLSVARHSIMVSQRLEAAGFRHLAKWGLLHDAPEAYLGDMPSPMKNTDAMKVFRDADERLEKIIADAFGLPYPMPSEVHEADRYVLVELELPDLRESYFGSYERDEADFLRRYAEVTGAPRTTRIIGVSGYAQSGKDTVAKALTPEGWQRIAFADKLRAFLYALDPMIPVPTDRHGLRTVDYRRLRSLVDERGWERAKVEIPEVRALLQRLGTEAGRGVLGEKVWIDAALQDIEPGGKYVVTDVRFMNEADQIRKLGGEVWRIERPGVGPANDHDSEHALDGYEFDHVIQNDGSRVDLRRKVLARWTPV